MKNLKHEIEKKFFSLNGYQLNAVKGGDDPGDNGEGGGETGKCTTNLQTTTQEECTRVYYGAGSTDNVCGTCPFHKNG